MPRNRIVSGGRGLGEMSGGAEKLLIHEFGRLLEVIRPMFFWPLMVVVSWGIRTEFPDNMYVLAFLAGASIIMSVIVFRLSHARGIWGQMHGPISVLLAGGVLDYIDVVGRTPAVMFICIHAIPLFLSTWCIRAMIRMQSEHDNDNLTALFEKAGIGETKVRFKAPKVGEAVKKLTGRIHLDPGTKTADDVNKATGRIESALKIPPGSFTAVPDEDRAAWANFTLSDPRVLRTPTP